MGQLLTTPTVKPGISPFLNLPRDALRSLLQSYSLHGEGWGVDYDQVEEIFSNAPYMVNSIGYTEEDLKTLFQVFDTDNNGLIDALELLITLALVSGMDVVDKLQFTFSTYDFDYSGMLSKEEISLLLRSAAKGLCKIADAEEPTSDVMDGTAEIIFNDLDRSKDGKISVYEFHNNAVQQPVLGSWLHCFGNIEPTAEPPVLTEQDIDVKLMGFAALEKSEPKPRHLTLSKADSMTDAAVVEAQKAVRLEELSKPEEPKKSGIFGSSSRPTSAKASSRSDAPLTPSLRPSPPAASTPTGLANSPKKAPVLSWFADADLLKPDEIPRTRRDPPEDVVEPSWMHGCRAADVRSHLKYGPNGSVLFFASAIAVQMLKDTGESGEGEDGEAAASGLWQQKFVFDHDAPITCIDYCAASRMVATADSTHGVLGTNKDGTEQQREARIVLWNAESTTSTAVIEIAECAGIRYLDFSSDGSRLLALSMDKRNTLYMYEVTTRKLIFSTLLGDNVRIMSLSFAKSASIFCVAGSTGIEFFTEDVGGYMGAGRMVNFNRNQGLFHTIGRQSKLSLTNCLSDFENQDEIISGNSSGSVIFWRGRNCVQVLAGTHEGPVLSLHYSQACRTLVSGGADGKVKLMRVATPATPRGRKCRDDDVRLLEVFASLDISNSDVLSRQIRSVCIYSDGSRALVGTKSGEIVELSCIGEAGDKPLVAAGGEEGEEPAEGEAKLRLGDDVNGGPILKAHWDNSADKFGTVSVWGLCKVPSGGFLSCGSDYTVRRWQSADGSAQKELKQAVFDSGVISIGCSAASVAVGFDGLGNEARAKTVHILNLDTLSSQQTLSDAAATVRSIQFSADGNLLACGCDDGVVLIYAIQEGAGYTLKGKLEGHTSAVNFMDFAADGQFLRSSEEGRIIYWDVMVNFGTVIKEAEVLKAIVWATSTTPYTWDAKGSFSELVGTETITCVDRSNHLVVSGLSSGAILLTRLPNAEQSIEAGGYRGVKQEAHCGRIAALCYIDEGAKLVTAGAEDGLIQVWKVKYDFDEGEPEPEPGMEGELEPQAVDEEEEDDESDEKGNKAPVYYDSADDDDLIDGQDMELPEIVHESNVALKPGASYEELNYWMESVGLTESSTWNMKQGSAPDAEMSLDWVYGYSSRLTRGSVRYTVDGSIAYPAATVAVVFDKKNRSQLHAMNHQGEISCMDVHRSSGYAVTAQRGKDHIFACVWNTATGACRGRMDCGRVHGASAIAFSPDGALVAVACQDFSHSILIFDWEHNVLRTRVSGGSQKVLNLSFSLAPVTYASGLRIVQGGVGHFQLLELKGRQLTAKRGLYGAGMPKRNVLCSAALPIFPSMESPNEFVVGMSDGSLGVLGKGERKFAQVVPLTSKAVTAVCVMKGADESAPFRVVTGSIDGHIRIIDHEFTVTNQYNIYLTSPSLYRLGTVRGIKSITVDKGNRKILYGTSAGEIGEMNVADGLDVNKGPLVTSHCRDFVTGVSTHPLRQECATVGGDKTLRIWNLERHSMNTMIELTDVASSVCYSPNAQLIAVGLGGTVRGNGRMPREHEGELVVVSYLQGTLRIVFGSKDAAGVFNAFVFSPDGAELYAGSEDGKIYVYDVLDDFKKLHELSHHTTGVRGLDISEDGRYLCSVGADNVLAVWDVNLYKILPDDKKNDFLANASWLTRTIPVGVDTLGVHQPHIAMNFVTSLHRSSDKKLVATSDCAGGVSLFSYPCRKPGAPYKEFFGHSPGGVAIARFTCRDDFLVSAGIDDKCLFQWKINKAAGTLREAVESSSEVRDTTAQDSAVSAIRRDSKAGGGVEAVRPLMLAQHTWQYHSFAQEEAAAATVDEDCNVPTGMGNVDFCTESDASPPELLPVLNSVLGMGGVSYIAGAKSSMPLAYYCGSGQVITSMGSLVYTYDSDRYGQAIWDIPDGQEIGAVAVSCDSRYVLVAEKPPAGMDKPDSPSFFAKQRIFNASTGSLIKILPGSIIGGVCAAAFSPDGLQAGCLSCDYQHSITMYNTPHGTWKDAVRTFVSQIDSAPITLLAFIMQSEEQGQSPFQFATGGEGALRFWKLRGRNATSSLHSNQATNSPKITAMTSLKPDQLITGDVEGHISIWEGRDFVKTADSAHIDMISALSKYQSKKYGHGLISGSNDAIVFWNEAYEQVMMFSIAQVLSKINRPYTSNAYVSTVCVDAGCRRMLVTLQSSYVLELALDSGAVLLVTEAHSLGKLSAVAAHPTDSRFVVSCGADGLLRLWNVVTRRPIAVENLENAATSMTFRKDGETLAISTVAADGQSGSIFILAFSADGNAARYVSIVDKVHNVGTAKISCLRYSPDEKMLLASSLDGKLYAFSVDKGYKVRAILSAHKGPCHSFDFSESGKFLRSFGKLRSENTAEMYFHDLTKPVEAGIGSSAPSFAMVKDEKILRELVSETWLTMSPGCPEARGARQVELHSGVGVTDIAKFGNICAAGYSDGTAKLFRSPPASIDAEGIVLRGHNSGGTKCAFTCDGKYLAVVGAADGSITVWSVKN